MTGFVSLVGAGPGDPELLTLRALRRLRDADLVLNDALVHAELLELAPKAQRFYVGKRAGRHSIDQAGIHQLMIRAAHRGQRVVRLKAGDPFGSAAAAEALALGSCRVACEVVPGLSSATTAPLLASIPVTHRGIASGFAVSPGRRGGLRAHPLAAAPGSLPLVVLMGLAPRPDRRRSCPDRPRLLWRHSPALAIARLVATGATEPATDLPAVLVIGEVVSLAGVIGQLHPQSQPQLHPQSQPQSHPTLHPAPLAERSL